MSRKIDALVAEHVMGLPVKMGPKPYQDMSNLDMTEYPWLKGRGTDGCYYDWGHVPKYSSDIAAAWLVVEEMGKTRYVAVGPNWAEIDDESHNGCMRSGKAPMAICLAALAAKKVEVPDED